MIRPEEKEQNNSMAEEIVEVLQEIVEVLQEASLRNLDKIQLYYISFGKAVSTEIEDCLITLDEKRK